VRSVALLLICKWVDAEPTPCGRFRTAIISWPRRDKGIYRPNVSLARSRRSEPRATYETFAINRLRVDLFLTRSWRWLNCAVSNWVAVSLPHA